MQRVCSLVSQLLEQDRVKDPCSAAMFTGAQPEESRFLERMLGSLATAVELADASQPTMPAQQLRVLMQFAHNESLLAALGASKEVSLPGSCHCAVHFAEQPGVLAAFTMHQAWCTCLMHNAAPVHTMTP